MKLVVTLLALVLVPRLAGATISYSADNLPGMGTCPNGTISWFMDPQYGRVIRVHVIDSTGSNTDRCEFVAPNGGRMPGETWYVGWRARVDAPITGSWNGIYQMKCHGPHVADQPLVLSVRNKRLTLENHEDIGGKETSRTVWSTDLPDNQWFSLVLRVHYSESRTEGSVQVWYNGQPQLLTSGTNIHHGQTWDGTENNMHWGIYRADEVSGPGDLYVWRPRVASTFEEANPDGKSEPPPPDGGTPDAGGADGAASVDAAVAADTMGQEATGGTSATGGAAGAGGRGGAGGTGGRAGATGGAGGDGEEEPQPPTSHPSKSSGCALGGDGGSALPLVLASLAALVRRRARR